MSKEFIIFLQFEMIGYYHLKSKYVIQLFILSPMLQVCCNYNSHSSFQLLYHPVEDVW